MRKDFITTAGFKTRKNGEIYVGRVPALFDNTEIADLIERAENIGYSVEALEEGSWGHGKLVLWAPKGYKNMIVREQAMNEWSSAHTVERFADLYPELQEEIDSCLNSIMEALDDTAPEQANDNLQSDCAQEDRTAHDQNEEPKQEAININIEQFLKQFRKEYAFLWDNYDNVAGYREAVDAFDEFAPRHKDFVCEFVKYRQDFISSDREAAAFMFALDALTPA